MRNLCSLYRLGVRCLSFNYRGFINHAPLGLLRKILIACQSACASCFFSFSRPTDNFPTISGIISFVPTAAAAGANCRSWGCYRYGVIIAISVSLLRRQEEEECREDDFFHRLLGAADTSLRLSSCRVIFFLFKTCDRSERSWKIFFRTREDSG